MNVLILLRHVNCYVISRIGELTSVDIKKRATKAAQVPILHIPTLQPMGVVHYSLHALPQEDNSIHPLIQPVLSSSSLDSATRRSLMALSSHIFGLEKELSILKQSSGTRDSSISHSSPSSTFQEVEPDSSGSSSTFEDDSDLAAHLKGLTISVSEGRHFGPSSTMSLVGTAIEIVKDSSREEETLDSSFAGFRRPEFWTVHPVSDDVLISGM